jgi:hypothetical protein
LSGLVSAAAELHKIMNEFMTPGISAEEHSVDMTTSENMKYFTDVNERLEEKKPKSVKFSAHPEIPLFKGEKRLKVLLSALVYVLPADKNSMAAKIGSRGFKAKEDSRPTAAFQLVRSCDRKVVEDSLFQTVSSDATPISLYLPFGITDYDEDIDTGVVRISPFEYEYHIQARSMNIKCIPVVRRFSLSTVYI